MTCQQRRQSESLTLMKGRIARIFSQKCWIYENWPWINWTWNPSQLKDYYYIVLLVKSAYHYFFLFSCTAFFFPSAAFFFFHKDEWSDNYFLNCWELFSCYLEISAVTPCLYRQRSSSVGRQCQLRSHTHHYTKYSAFLRQTFFWLSFWNR